MTDLLSDIRQRTRGVALESVVDRSLVIPESRVDPVLR